MAILADPHSNLLALISVLDRVRSMGLTTILLAGDLVGYGPYPNEVVERVIKEKMICITGNHDDAAINRDYSDMNPLAAIAAEWTSNDLSENSLEFLKGLPRYRILQLGGRSIGLFHGSPDDPYEYVLDNRRALELLEETNNDVIIVGHTHVPMLSILKNRIFLNPGGVGQPRDGIPTASFALLELESLEVEFLRVEYDIATVQNRMFEVGLPSFLISRLSIGY